jgi:hypothetical protein
LVKAFVGVNYEYYYNKWIKLCNNKNQFSLNWIAVLFGPVWFAYRKMYVFLFSFYGGMVLLDIILSNYFEINIPTSSFTVADVIIGLNANSLYLYYVKKKIYKIKSSKINDLQINDSIAKKGGISVISAIITGILMVISVIALVYDIVNKL